MKISFFAVIAFIFSYLTCDAQTFTADIKDLSFMSGKWFTHPPWGDMEEYWGEPLGNNMISSYRCVKDGKVIFYEFVVIEQSDSVPVMILRNFKPGNIAWEDKEHPERYPLVALRKNQALFMNSSEAVSLTYELVNRDSLDVILEEKNKEGKSEKTSFHYTRKE